MEVFFTTATLQNYLNSLKNKTVGFVPTMGALHAGHIALVNASLAETDFTVCSIFVNPTQFNNTDDFAKYPRTTDDDLEQLRDAGCTVAYVPETPEEVYAGYVTQTFDFKGLDQPMEGQHRPGHFQGMANVVYRLFDIVKPTKAFFGEKDYQQLTLVTQIVAPLFSGLTIVPCPTLREADKLAMSSRNRRLSPEARQTASKIPLLLQGAQFAYATIGQFAEIDMAIFKKSILKDFERHPDIELEYYEIADETTLLPATSNTPKNQLRQFIACNVGGVRLIDNMPLITG